MCFDFFNVSEGHVINKRKIAFHYLGAFKKNGMLAKTFFLKSPFFSPLSHDTLMSTF
jgi:hypothetical protein